MSPATTSSATQTLPYRPDVVAETMTWARQFFRRSTSVLEEQHADFAPQPELLTVKEQVAHVAHTVDWFLDALENGEFDMDFESHVADYKAMASLAEAFAWFDRAFDRAEAYLAAATAEQLAEPMAENAIMNGAKGSLFSAVAEHTAHHRGVLTVYSRLQGLVPPMPYLQEGEQL